MKNLFLFASMFLWLTACKNETKIPPATNDVAKEVVPEQPVAQSPNQTDADFNVAIAAFRKKDYTTASVYITNAIADLKKEDIALDAKTKAHLAATIATLESMAVQVKSGKVKSEADMQEMLALVDMLSSHQYLLLTSAYAKNAPEKANSSFEKAGGRVERAVLKMDVEAKKEGNTIRDKINAALARGDRKADAIGNAAGEQVVKIAAWINKHAERLGIKPPSSN